jgi:peptidoglycan/xylan/chitin deacetylase (PgdA/CDA1 family)
MKNTIKSFVKPILVSLASQFGPHARNTQHEKLWILMYHRILPQNDNRFLQEEPGMLVQPDTFAMHIKELKREFELMFLGDWVSAKLKGESLPKKTCVITFDDGWLDNYEYAFPALKAESAPATLFAVTEKIGTDFQFWPNIVSVLLLSGAANALSQHPQFHFLNAELKDLNRKNDKNIRDKIAAIIFRLKQLSDAAIYTALDEINWRSLCPAELPHALMNWDQLKAMKESGLVEIGSHTCNHKRLTPALSSTELEHEIVESKHQLQKQLNTPIDLFCFPNGDYSAEALGLVKHNYKAAVTTRRGINIDKNSSGFYELTRIGMHDEVSHSRNLFRSRLSQWL